MGDYINQSDIEDAITPQTVVRLFDDANTGAASVTAINRVIATAEVIVSARINRAYPTLTLPVTLASQRSLMIEASLMFAIPLSYRRHPEYVRTTSDSCRWPALMTQAFAFLEWLCTGTQFPFSP